VSPPLNNPRLIPHACRRLSTKRKKCRQLNANLLLSQSRCEHPHNMTLQTTRCCVKFQKWRFTGPLGVSIRRKRDPPQIPESQIPKSSFSQLIPTLPISHALSATSLPRTKFTELARVTPAPKSMSTSYRLPYFPTSMHQTTIFQFNHRGSN
jgi:hypothetical protein